MRGATWECEKPIEACRRLWSHFNSIALMRNIGVDGMLVKNREKRKAPEYWK